MISKIKKTTNLIKFIRREMNLCAHTYCKIKHIELKRI